MSFLDDFRTGKKIANFSKVRPAPIFAFFYACRKPKYQALQRHIGYADVLRDRRNGLRP